MIARWFRALARLLETAAWPPAADRWLILEMWQ